ncbi:FtsH protease activity modulator HflK [Paralcaligenes sp. KSB-10]|uniref:FtsH protease activity modulator HflK n=1 Tax=Paralcaligenes sp. KSB-10 TaxID=2901142 RepID=UPI001E2B3380|nr:FtsH protease activity modulator HflK [Paralcaligenes sp. KSB-10]UHL65106.1 FtsH protease activity modulator HflK [Paralcaligenes sp. KSB-10]
MRLMSKIFNLNDPGWGRGNNNGSEPPRRPNKGEGPPDLDEVWRDFNNRIGSLFGRKPKRGGSSNGGSGGGNNGSFLPMPKNTPKVIAIVLIIALGLWLASGFLIVQEGQVAVVTKFGKYKATLPPGLQWRLPYPIEDHQMVNISQLRTFEVGFRGSSRNKILPESLMLTNDENIVDVQFVVQYRLMSDGAPDYLFKTSHPDESVRQVAETAMREIVGKKPMDFILYSGRTEVAADVQKLTQSILDRYKTGIQISTVAIQNVQPPEQVQAAFDDAVKAGQDRERQINEGNAYSNKVLPEAQGQVARLVQEAEGYRAKVVGDALGDTARFNSIEAEYAKAPEILRERLYLSTMQEILERASKVMIDTQSSNNMLYLPLDKIMQQVSRAQTDANAPIAAAAAAATTPAPSTTKPAASPVRRKDPPASLQDSLSINRFSR